MEEKKRLGIGSVHRQVPAEVSNCLEDCSMCGHVGCSLKSNLGIWKENEQTEPDLFLWIIAQITVSRE